VAFDSSWKRLRCLGLLVVLIGGLAVACGSGPRLTEVAKTTDSSIGDPTDPTAATDPGTTPPSDTPSRATPGAVVTAPLNVPAIGGNGIDSVRADAEAKFKALCGGTVCVQLVNVIPKQPVGEYCDVVWMGATSPPTGSPVQRGSVVQLLFELDPDCAPAQPDATTSTTAPTHSSVTSPYGATTTSPPTTIR